jgi:hypothetical protein
MVAHFLEASVMFQNSDVLIGYLIIFGALAIMCAATFFSAQKTKIE